MIETLDAPLGLLGVRVHMLPAPSSPPPCPETYVKSRDSQVETEDQLSPFPLFSPLSAVTTASISVAPAKIQASISGLPSQKSRSDRVCAHLRSGRGQWAIQGFGTLTAMEQTSRYVREAPAKDNSSQIKALGFEPTVQRSGCVGAVL